MIYECTKCEEKNNIGQKCKKCGSEELGSIAKLDKIPTVRIEVPKLHEPIVRERKKVRLEDMTHEDKYTAIVNEIGLDFVVKWSPITIEKARAELMQGNKPLNGIVPLESWDSCSSFIRSHIVKAVKKIDPNYRGGVSLSMQVCTLKHAVRMKAREI